MIVCAGLISAAGMNVSATTNVFDNGGTDDLWSNVENWDVNGIPGSTDWAKHTSKAVVLTVNSAAEALDLNVSHLNTAIVSVVTGGDLNVGNTIIVGNDGGAGSTGVLVVDGGAVNVGSDLVFGVFGNRLGIGELKTGSIKVGSLTRLGGWNIESSGELTISGGNYINTNGMFEIGRSGSGLFNMDGGVLQLQENVGVVWNPLRIGNGSGDATLNLNGGTIFTGGMIMNGSQTRLNLRGGSLQVETAGSWSVAINNDAQMVFDAGTFVWKGNRIANFSSLVASNAVSWSNGMTNMLTESWDACWTNGMSVLYADYNDATTGYTTVWAAVIPQPKGMVICIQ